jgi:Holliday junction resolvase-like predicted endonuclease
MSSLRQNLMDTAYLNAFNDAFDSQLLAREIHIAIEQKVSHDDISAADAGYYFNGVYKEFYEKLKEVLSQNIFTVNGLEKDLMANCNRAYFLIKKDAKAKMIEEAQDNGALFSNSFSNTKIEGANGQLYASDGLDNYIDALNIIFTSINHLPRVKIKEKVNDEKLLNALLTINYFSVQASTYKTCYDELVWQNRRAEIGNEAIYIIPIDKNLEEITNIGKITIDQAIVNVLIQITSSIRSSNKIKEAWNLAYRENRKKVSLKNAFVNNGYVRYFLQDEYSQNHINFDIELNASIAVYYEFILDAILPSAAGLAIRDVTLLYAELVELIHMLEDNQIELSNSISYEILYTFPFRIKKNHLKNYLHQKTHYSIDQINAFVKLLIHEKGRFNFWKKPFVQRGADLLFSMLPLTGSRILYIVDEWLKVGGYSLKARGDLFEEYIKSKLAEGMGRKKYFCNILKQKKFKVSNKEYEEIDLIAEFKHCLLICEVKCIRYPLEARDKHNAYATVIKASLQLNKKIEFLQKNSQHFTKLIPGLGVKPIVKAIITNYPLFSGLAIDGIPVSDATFLDSYVTKGKARRGFSFIDSEGKRDYMDSEEVIYYNNEDEFSKNLPHFLAHPVFVEFAKDFCSWHMSNPISDVFTEFVNINFSMPKA